jgi:menaquinone-dependent protoporphyrinogen oxidase
MANVLVLFSSFDGQTRRIAQYVGEVLRTCGNTVTVLPVDAEHAGDAIALHDAVVVGAAIRYGHHAIALERFVRRHARALAQRRGAFFSVCLSAGRPGAKPAEARRYVDGFLARTGWSPQLVTSFAGALRYSAYNPFIRMLMKFIVGMAGGETNTARDYEYTDWTAVDQFARQCA